MVCEKTSGFAEMEFRSSSVNLQNNRKERVSIFSEIEKCEVNSTQTATKCFSSGKKEKKNQQSIETNSSPLLKATPKYFQKVQTFVACLATLQLIQVMGSGYGKSTLTSIERRYRLTTFEVGVLQSCFHIGNLSVILFVSYCGSKWHRPRAIAIGSLVMTASSLLSASPQFFGERYLPFQRNDFSNDRLQYRNVNVTITEISRSNRVNSSVLTPSQSLKESVVFSTPNVGLLPIMNEDQATNVLAGVGETTDFGRHVSYATDISHAQLCTSSGKTTSTTAQRLQFTVNAKEEPSDDSSLYLFIAFGSVLKGMGHTPLHPLGMSFIDDFATARNSGVYIGLVSALSLVGPAVGFLLGSVTASMWVDSGWVTSAPPNIDPLDPEWVGAWWLGYLVTALLLLIVTIPMSMFPKVIPKEEESQTQIAENGCIFCLRRYYSNNNPNSDVDNNKGKIRLSTSSCTPSQQTPAHLKTSLDDNKTNDRNLSLQSNFDSHTTTSHITSSTKDDKASPRTSIMITQRDIYDELQTTLFSETDKGTLNTDAQYLKTSNRVQRSASAPVFPDSNTKIRVSRALSYHEHRSFRNRFVFSRSNFNISRTESVKDFAFSLKNLLRDPVFISITLGFVNLTSFLAASITYVSKYMENQFNLTASFANLLNGSVNLPMAVVGNVLGGWLIRRYNLNVKRTISLVLLGLFLTITAVSTLVFLGCENDAIVGLKSSEQSACVAKCGCDEKYHPVCDVATNTTYRSACYAGCKNLSTANEDQIFFDCQCLQKIENWNKSKEANGPPSVQNFSIIKLKNGACPRPVCWHALSIFVAVMGSASMAAGLAATPSTLTILRVVPSSEKAFAIGIVFVFTRVLAWIPAPVYVGAAIDTSCLLWTSSAFGRQLADQRRCEVYDKRKLRTRLFGSIGLQLLLALVFNMIALYLVTRRHKARGQLKHGGTLKSKKDEISGES
ncbi:solute carrier organic anion transporter family member 2A1-like [Clavelina lepadiformis]|uniref:solute carrier organic anion transporter family member 2A1-like n=1 Tax=Clavelina lepadiformis TaxID=159417 RepID=UPI004042D8B1